VGHGNATASALAAIVMGAGITIVVDVRRFPGSRRHPQYGHDEMARWLSTVGIGYRWLPALGARRKLAPGSPNIGLRNPQFRAYADHMASSALTAGFDVVLSSPRPVRPL
jgi:uncharacterized protein (DUF488 family)